MQEQRLFAQRSLREVRKRFWKTGHSAMARLPSSAINVNAIYMLDEMPDHEIDWAAGQELTGCSDMQVAFVKALCAGASQTGAAKAAGYSGDGAGLRAAASRIAKGNKVRALLAWAKAGGAGPPSEPGDLRELKKILWKHARGTDKTHSIRATELLHRLEEKEREAAVEVGYDAVATLDALAVHSPVLAAYLAVSNSLPWPPRVNRHSAMRELEAIRVLIEKHTDTAGVLADA